MEVLIGSVLLKNLNYSLPYVRIRLVTYPVGSDGPSPQDVASVQDVHHMFLDA